MAHIVIGPVAINYTAFVLHSLIESGSWKRGKDIIKRDVNPCSVHKVNGPFEYAQIIPIQAQDETSHDRDSPPVQLQDPFCIFIGVIETLAHGVQGFGRYAFETDKGIAASRGFIEIHKLWIRGDGE